MRSPRRLLLVALFSVLAGSLSVDDVHAAPDSKAQPTAANLAKGREAFQRGAALAADARWGDALVQFQQSASLVPHATTTYNIGYCERALGRSTSAKKYFARALAQDDAHAGELAVDLRAATKKFVDEMRARIATPTLSISPADATVTVDGAPLELSDDGRVLLAGTRAPGPGEKIPASFPAIFVLEVDAGAHQIAVVAPDGRTKVAQETFAANETRVVTVEVPPAPDVAPRDTSQSTRRTWGLVLGGVGVVGLGVGTFLGLAARSNWSEARDACPARTTCPDDRGSTLSARAKKEANAATIGFVAGGAALVGGTILFFTAKPTEQVSLHGGLDARGGGWLMLRGSF